MRGGPRAAGACLSEAADRGASRRWPATRRLLSPAQFAAVTSDPQALRSARRWLALAARRRTELGAAPVRFGFAASRRLAPLAVQRNTVKRILREAARHHLATLDAAVAGGAADVVLRLKARVPARGELTLAAWKAALRAEADALLDRLAAELRAQGGA